MPDAHQVWEDDPIDSEWENLRRRTGNDEQHQSFPAPPGFPDANLLPEVRGAVQRLRAGSAINIMQRTLVELAIAFSIRPENVPDDLLLEREKATLRWVSMSPYYPMSSPREAMELVRVAVWLKTKPGQEERAARADALWRVLEPAPWVFG